MRLEAKLVRDVDEEELARLLGYPPGHGLEGEVRNRTLAARRWYGQNGDPSATVRIASIEAWAPNAVRLEDGIELQSRRLARRLRNVHTVAVAAITAGSRVDEEISQRWREDRVDEAFFLDRLAAAFVEHVAFRLGAGAFYAPGYNGWALEEQTKLGCLLGGDVPAVTVLPSGGLLPKASLLGLYPRGAGVSFASPGCRGCDLADCSYRRVA